MPRKRTAKRKRLWNFAQVHLIATLIMVMFCVTLYTAVYLNRCINDWRGKCFRSYDGYCSSYFFGEKITRAATGWYFQMDNGAWYFIPCDVCNRDDFGIDVIAANSNALFNICYMPSTFLRYDNVVVSMKINGEELVPQSAMYDYIEDRKMGCMIVTPLTVLCLIIYLPFIIISDIELYQERQQRKKRNGAKSRSNKKGL